jgi:hypothetical protein
MYLIVRAPSIWMSLCPAPVWRKKTARFECLAVGVDSVFALRAPFDSFRQGLEKAIKVEKVETRGREHGA